MSVKSKFGGTLPRPIKVFGINDRQSRLVPEFIDPVFTKTSPKRSFSLNRKRAFWLVFAKTRSIISGIGMQLFSGRMWTAHNAYLQNDWELVYVEKRMY
jgi:hypothetical protein